MSGTTQFVHRAGDPLAVTLSTPVGTTLRLRLEPAAGYRWTIVESSDPQIATVSDTAVAADGTADATVTTHTPGTVQLTAATSYQPDRFGPPTRLWRMNLTVTPQQEH